MLAAGHSPEAIGSWTWAQLFEVATCIQSYHLDLAARIATGKSPALEGARKPPEPTEEALRSVWDTKAPRGTREAPTYDQVDQANREATEAFMQLQQSQQGRGNMAGFKVADPARPQRDLFREWRERRAATLQEADQSER